MATIRIQDVLILFVQLPLKLNDLHDNVKNIEPGPIKTIMIVLDLVLDGKYNGHNPVAHHLYRDYQ